MIRESERMRNLCFRIIFLSFLLAVCPAILPVTASLNGSMAQTAGPAAVTISALPPAGGSYNFGDEIIFSGTNTGSNTTYLFFTGPGLNDVTGSQIDSAVPRISPSAITFLEESTCDMFGRAFS